jgi:cellulose synthase/poly-beta-1,6-N-acetylglucosamine synthase-like glycosyltransferase
MLVVFGYSIFLILLYFSLLIFIVGFSFAGYRSKNIRPAATENLPKVSVLIAVRNEEENIVRCLEALNKLDYPKDRMEILIGNDDSTDNTTMLVDKFIQGKKQFAFYNISIRLGKAKAKANVLAHLSQIATGEFLFTTDADIAVPQTWIKGMIPHFENNVAIVSGTTYVEGKSLFARLQSLDWLFFGGVINSFANAGIPSTGVGNNMVIRASAYHAIGGYENLDFSVTEDFKIYDSLRKAGFGWKNILNKETVNVSKPVKAFKDLMQQRQRWITGSLELPWYWKIIFIIFGFFSPAMIAVLLFAPKVGLLIWFIKIFAEGIFIANNSGRIGRTENLGSIIIYQLYAFITPFFYLYFILRKEPTMWKGRAYS